MEDRARTILGLDDPDLPALPPRIEQLWRLDRFAAHIPLINTMFVPMGAGADLGLVRETVAILAHRHEALRTRLAVENGRAIQIAEGWNEAEIALADVRKRDLDDDRPGAPKSAVSEFSQRPMNLHAQDSFHVQAFRDESAEITLGLASHYFFSDAWSAQILRKEIRAIFDALKAGASIALEPAGQYRDYAQDQRHALAKNLPAQLGYWRQRLENVPPPRLPYDHHKETGLRGRCFFSVSKALETSLAGIAQVNRVSLAALLMTAYQASLARWSGQDQILSAAYTADRLKPETHATVGSLIVNMPVACRIDRQARFLPFLLDQAREFYGSYAYRELSCELYDAIFAPPKPFCGTVFNFVPVQKSPSSGAVLSLPSFDGIIAAPEASRPALYRELYLGLVQHSGGILGKLYFNADFFTAAGMETYVGHFRHVIGKIAEDPQIRLGALLA